MCPVYKIWGTWLMGNQFWRETGLWLQISSMGNTFWREKLWGTVTNFKFCLSCLNTSSPQWGTVTNFKFCLYSWNTSSPQWGTVNNFKFCFSCLDTSSPKWGTVTNFKVCLYCLNTSSPLWGTIIPARKVRLYIQRPVFLYSLTFRAVIMVPHNGEL